MIEMQQITTKIICQAQMSVLTIVHMFAVLLCSFCKSSCPWPRERLSWLFGGMVGQALHVANAPVKGCSKIVCCSQKGGGKHHPSTPHIEKMFFKMKAIVCHQNGKWIVIVMSWKHCFRNNEQHTLHQRIVWLSQFSVMTIVHSCCNFLVFVAVHRAPARESGWFGCLVGGWSSPSFGKCAR